MTEQELREKIVKILEEAYEPIEYGDDDIHGAQIYFPSNEDVANALISAGIGYVSKWKDKAPAAELVAQAAANAAIERIEEWKHRAKVAEKAFDLINKENPSCFVPYSCCGLDCRECTKKYFYEQAEKELPKERENDK